MPNNTAKQFETISQEIHEYIDSAIKSGFITDKSYEAIKVHITTFDKLRFFWRS